MIVATFNRAASLAPAIESVQAQTLSEIEILVCDDCSTDGTSEVVARLQGKDARIRYLRTDTNGGPARARDMGFRAAKAPYLTTLDSDDIYMSARKLDCELALADSGAAARPKIGYSRQVILDENCRPVPMQPSKPLRTGDIFFPVLTRSCDVPRDFVFPRDLYFDVGGYDFELPVYEDWDLKLRFAARADFALTGEDGTGYVQHAAGLSRVPRCERQFWLNYVFRRHVARLAPERQEDARQVFSEVMRQSGFVPHTETAAILTERQLLGEGLIFIFSLPRSGSTLLQRVLAGHSQIYTRSEPWLLLHPLYARRRGDVMVPYNHNLARLGVDDFIADLPGTEENYFYWLRTCFAGLYRDIARKHQAAWYLDKTPRYHQIADDIMEVFPRAKFILLWRHPLAVLRSMYEDVQFDVRKMSHWKIDLGNGLANLLKLKETGRCIEVYYEQFVAAPAAELERLMQRLGISFEPGLLDVFARDCDSEWRFGDKKKAWSTKTIEAQSVDLWRDLLRADPNFAALARAMVRHKRAECASLSYDLTDFEPSHGLDARSEFDHLFAVRNPRAKAKEKATDATFVVRMAERLASAGPIPYALGRAAWRAYRGLAARHS